MRLLYYCADALSVNYAMQHPKIGIKGQKLNNPLLRARALDCRLQKGQLFLLFLDRDTPLDDLPLPLQVVSEDHYLLA